MTFTQQVYIDAIEKYKKEYHEIPSIRTISKLVLVNCPSTVFEMLKRLKNKGYNYKEMKNYENE